MDIFIIYNLQDYKNIFDEMVEAMLNPLTSFRFFAALAVFLFHLRFFKQGYLGVSFFFVLSGFILTYNYLGKLKTLDREEVFKFYISRIARIYPVHVLTFVLSIPLVFSLYVTSPVKSIIKVILNLSLTQSFIPTNGVYFSFNLVSWSLSDELFFYLLLPLVLLVFSKKIVKRTELLATLICIWLIATSIVVVFRDNPLSSWLFYILPIFRLGDFCIGVLLALLFTNSSLREKLSSRSFSLLEFMALIGMGAGMYFIKYVHPSLRFDVYYIPFVSFVIYIFAFQRGIFSKFLSKKAFIFLGEISFSFYMIHQLAIYYLEYMPALKNSPILLGIISFVLCLVISSIIYTYYEIPLRNVLRSKLHYFSKRRLVKEKMVA